MLDTLKKYKHGLLIPLYALIYIPWFVYLEQTVRVPEHIIHTALDDAIPFIEVFIIPYMLWFVYISAVVLFLMIKDRKEYYRLMIFLIIGMTLFLIVSTIYPNGHTLRPAYFERDNIFTRMVAQLYRTDSPNNILPSIHVFNSLVAWFAIHNSRLFKNRTGIRAASFTMTSLIILSTMFIKQHSVLDVSLAFLLAGVMYPVFYMAHSPAYHKGIRSRKQRRPIYIKS